MPETTIQIPAELFAIAESSRFEGEFDLPVLECGPDEYRFEEPMSWQVDVTNTGSAFLVEGKVSGRATCSCSRCLEDVEHDFSGHVEGYFLIGQDAAGDADEDGEDLGEDEFELLPADHRIDLAPLMKAALLVDAPNMPLCKDDCAGLCPSCGANLNEGACGCGGDEGLKQFDEAANPFSALASLRFDDDRGSGDPNGHLGT